MALAKQLPNLIFKMRDGGNSTIRSKKVIRGTAAQLAAPPFDFEYCATHTVGSSK
jgi:hypothetical protein